MLSSVLIKLLWQKTKRRLSLGTQDHAQQGRWTVIAKNAHLRKVSNYPLCRCRRPTEEHSMLQSHQPYQKNTAGSKVMVVELSAIPLGSPMPIKSEVYNI